MSINHKILKESREYLSLSLAKASELLHYEENTISKLEEGKKQPTYNQLLNFSNLYCQPISIFYLKKFPFFDFKKDFRIKKEQYKDIDIEDCALKQLLLRTKKYVDIYNMFETKSLPTYETIKKLVQFVKKHISYNEQVKSENIFKFLLEKIENIFPILIFQSGQDKFYSTIDKSIQGITITFPSLKNKAIFINSKNQTTRSKAFSLLHELCHVLLKQETEETSFLKSNNIEERCNEFASEILLPKEIFDKIKNKKWDLKSIEKEAKKLNISILFFALRLLKDQKINEQLYQVVKKKSDEVYEESLKKKPKGGGPNTHFYTKRNIKGRNYIQAIYDAYANNDITYSKALSYLELKKHKHFVDLVTFL